MLNQPLFTPYRMRDLDLPNRIVMAPLTRMRAQSHDHVPTTLQVEYYAQRASAGLIITEATAISPEGFGWADTPGLWTKEQVRGWRRVTDAVHAAGGRIIAQLWHTGAISHPELLDGAQPVSASNVDPGQVSVTDGKEANRNPAVFDEAGDSSHGCGLRTSCAKRDRSGLRRCPDPRQLSLFDLAISERYHQPA
jgi:2,4-dienoyl-CoA reductase-like NADH-dependent reductase (Old Yellow Enzyme family)